MRESNGAAFGEVAVRASDPTLPHTDWERVKQPGERKGISKFQSSVLYLLFSCSTFMHVAVSSLWIGMEGSAVLVKVFKDG